MIKPGSIQKTSLPAYKKTKFLNLPDKHLDFLGSVLNCQKMAFLHSIVWARNVGRCQVHPSVFIWLFQDIWNTSGEHIPDTSWSFSLLSLDGTSSLGRREQQKLTGAPDARWQLQQMKLLVYTPQAFKQTSQIRRVLAKPFLPSQS